MADNLDFWDHYQQQTETTAIYPGRGSTTGLVYVALGLAGEAGEVADQVKKILRDDGNVLTDARKDKLTGEIGDALWYWARGATELGLIASEVARLGAIASSTPAQLTLLRQRTSTSIAYAALALCHAAAAFGESTRHTLFHDRPVLTSNSVQSQGVVDLLDVFHWLRELTIASGLDLRAIAEANLAKLAARKEHGTLQGSGSDR